MTEPLDAVFASTFMYSACKVVGADKWDDYRRAQLADLDESEWPGFRTLGNLSRVCPIDAFVDASTYIDRARCVAAGHFLAGERDVWVTVDDDIEADAHVMMRLVLACRATRGGVAVPYLNRDGRSMTFRRLYGPVESAAGQALRAVDRIGFGLVALHRDLVVLLAEKVPHFRESERSSVRCPVLFRSGDVDDGVWMGEDYYVSKLAEKAGRPLRALLEAPIAHAGLLAMVDLQGRIAVEDPEAAARLDTALRARENREGCIQEESQGQ